MIKVYYFPFTEFLLFVLAFILAGIGFFMGLNRWLSIIIVIISYVLTVGNSYIIKLAHEKITIIPLSPFSLRRSISLNLITKISSQESYTIESDLTMEATYPLFKRNYCMHYLDEKGRQKTVSFSINNKTKEKELMNVIKDTIANASR